MAYIDHVQMNGTRNEIVSKPISDSIAEEFSTSKAYAVGDMVMREGTLYKFTAAHTAGAWNAEHVTTASVDSEIGELKDALSELDAIRQNDFVKESIYSNLESGGIGSNDKNVDNINNRLRTGMIPINGGSTFVINLTSNFNARIYARYYAEKAIPSSNVGLDGWFEDGHTFTAPLAARYFRLLIKDENDINISLADVQSLNIQRFVNPISSRNTTMISESVFEYIGGGNGHVSESDIEQGSLQNGLNYYNSSYYSLRLRSKDYIPVVGGNYIYVDVTSNKDIDNSLSFFSSNDWITNQIATTGWRKNNEKIVVPQNARYCRITLKTSDDTAISPNDITRLELKSASIEDVFRSVDEYYRVPFETYPGYLHATTGMPVEQQQDKLQIYTSMIDIQKYRDLCIRVKYDEPQVMWVAIGQYDENTVFISRAAIAFSNSNSREFYFDNVDYADNTRYISITLYAYGYSNPLAVYAMNTDRNCYYNVIAHRGYSEVAPENTKSAYCLAKTKGFTFVETDARFTSDNVPVCLHDATINRTSNGSGSISSMTYEQASQYDFGSWKSNKYVGEKILKFDDFVALCKQLSLVPYIELKDAPTDAQCELLFNIVKKYGMQRHVIWFGASKSDVSKILALDPFAEVGISVETLSSQLIDDAISIKTQDNKVFLMASNGVTDELAAVCASNNIPLGQWTINGLGDLNPARYFAVLHPYATIILTNHTQFWNIFVYEGFSRS